MKWQIIIVDLAIVIIDQLMHVISCISLAPNNVDCS